MSSYDTTPSSNPYTGESQHEWIEIESRRLSTMDEWVDEISKSFIGAIADKQLLDIGSGPPTLLQESVELAGGRYIALDINKDFLLKHHPETPKIMSLAEKLPFDNRSIDITHSRAVLAWLPNTKRELSIQEQLRVTNERAIFVNFDWGSIKGEAATQQLKFLMMQVLSLAGFLPEYGKRQAEEIGQAIAKSGEDAPRANITHHITSSKPTNYLNLVEDSVSSVVTLLRANPETQSVASMMQTRLDAFKKSGETFTLPDIHTTIVSFDS